LTWTPARRVIWATLQLAALGRRQVSEADQYGDQPHSCVDLQLRARNVKAMVAAGVSAAGADEAAGELQRGGRARVGGTDVRARGQRVMLHGGSVGLGLSVWQLLAQAPTQCRAWQTQGAGGLGFAAASW
jgi:hypothetical protein